MFVLFNLLQQNIGYYLPRQTFRFPLQTHRFL